MRHAVKAEQTERLRALMDEESLAVLGEKLTAADVANITGRSVNTVYVWLTASSEKAIPEGMLAKLELWLSQQASSAKQVKAG